MTNPGREDGYPAEKARQGRIVLDTPARRMIFIGGLMALVVAVIMIAVLT